MYFCNGFNVLLSRESWMHEEVNVFSNNSHRGPKMNELVKESELKRFRYLPPRDRMRIEKQKKADEEAERMK